MTQKDTAAYLAAFNPLLDIGEAVYERDTGKCKIGPGYWNDLPYHPIGADFGDGVPIDPDFIDSIVELVEVEAGSVSDVDAGTGITVDKSTPSTPVVSLSSATQESLAKADTAVQPENLGTLAAKDKVAISDIDTTGLPDETKVLYGDGEWRVPPAGGDGEGGGGTVSAWGDLTGSIDDQTDLKEALDAKADVSSLATVATTGSYNDLSNRPSLATVATTGSYNDLTSKPSIPASAADLSAVPTSRTVTAGTGLSGGGDLSANRTLSLSAGAQASLAKADTALQPGGALPVDTIVYSEEGGWPSVASDGLYRIWVQPDPEGPPPPAGGRPGRMPGDIVFMAQTSGE